MARPIRIEYPGAVYYVSNYSREGRSVFQDQGDYDRFMEYLRLAGLRFGTFVHCYCFLPSEYHLVVETPRGKLSAFMRYLMGLYVMRSNKKYAQLGSLFRGRYKSMVLEKKECGLSVSRYIHLLPFTKHICGAKDLGAYAHSSLKFYLFKQLVKPEFLTTKCLLSQCRGPKKSREEAFRDFTLREPGFYKTFPYRPKREPAIGSNEFCEEVRGKILAMKKNEESGRLGKWKFADRSLKEWRALVDSLTPDPVLRKKLLVYVLKKYTALSLRQIGARVYGRATDHSAISQAARRLEIKSENNRSLRSVLRKLEVFAVSNSKL